MALPATLVHEIRPTNGTADAGGAFDPSVASPGTDYSQQNAVQVAYTDLVVDAVTNTDVTSAGTPFTSAHVGNNIEIVSGAGWTPGPYNIRSVTAAKARLDRSPAAVGTTAGVGNLGGARSGLSNGTTARVGQLVAGNKVWIKNEAWNEAVAWTVNGTAALPIIVEGYSATRGDTPLGANRPRNNRAGAAGNVFSGNVTNHIYRNIWVSNAGSTGGWANNSVSTTYINCRSSNNVGYGFNVAGALMSCEGDNNSTTGLTGAGTAVTAIHDCYFHDNTTIGINVSGVTANIVRTISEANTTRGVLCTTSSIIMDMCVIDGNGDDGVETTTTFATGSSIRNTIISNNTGYAINAVTNGSSLSLNYNCYYTNGAGNLNNATAGANDQVDVNPGFVDRTNANFAIGTNLKALGSVGAIQGSGSTGYLDIGAIQRQEAGGGSYGSVG